jgi:hypothetical protein
MMVLNLSFSCYLVSNLTLLTGLVESLSNMNISVIERALRSGLAAVIDTQSCLIIVGLSSDGIEGARISNRLVNESLIEAFFTDPERLHRTLVQVVPHYSTVLVQVLAPAAMIYSQSLSVLLLLFVNSCVMIL